MNNNVNNNMNQNNETQYTQKEIITNSNISNYDKSQNKKTMLLVIAIITFFISLVIGFIIYVYTTIKTTVEKHENQDNTNTNETIKTTKLQSGIYELNGVQIKILQNQFTYYKIENTPKECYVYDNYERCIFMSIPFTDEYIYDYYLLKKLTIQGNENELIVSSEDYDIPSGTYTKIKNYTEKDFKNEAVGNLKYLNTNINGIFEKDFTTIEIFQLDENNAAIKIETPDMDYHSVEKIEDNMIISENNFGYSIKINFTEKSLTILSYDEIQESILNTISGTYTKVRNLTADDIYDNMY